MVCFVCKAVLTIFYGWQVLRRAEIQLFSLDIYIAQIFFPISDEALEPPVGTRQP